MFNYKFSLIFSLFFLNFISLLAQTDQKLVLKEIIIEGNRKTKSPLILRELDKKINDSIAVNEIESFKARNIQKIFNTQLFVKVDLEIVKDSLNSFYSLKIKVDERWYTFPKPILELADRNFNEWWYQRGRDLRRTNFGFALVQGNCRGRNEELRLLVQGGFTHKYQLYYDIPYLSKRMKEGLNVGVSYIENKQIAVITDKNALVYYPIKTFSESVLRTRFSAFAEFRYRNSFYTNQFFEIKYYNNHINDTIAKLNSNYFLDSATQQSYFGLKYTYNYDRRDIRAYSLKGHQCLVEIEKLGISKYDNLDMLMLKAMWAQYIPLSKKWFFAGLIRGKISTQARQPYFNIQGLGYNQEFVRGYDLFVIDGTAYGMNRLTLRRKLKEYNLNMGELMPLKQFKKVPMSIYLNFFSDAGYVYHPNPTSTNAKRTNTLLNGYGMGLDIVTYYDSVFRFEYSINQEGGMRMFLYFTSDI